MTSSEALPCTLLRALAMKSSQDSLSTTVLMSMLAWTPLHVAARHNSFKVAQLLLSDGAHIDWPSECGRMPLHHAAYHGHIEMACLLVQHGADSKKRSKKKNPPGKILRDVASAKGSSATQEMIDYLSSLD